MDSIAFILSILANIGLLVVILLGRSYLSFYVNEKAKNAATREDIEVITRKIEQVKSTYQIEIERAKHEYELNGSFVERKRLIYEEISSSLRVFIEGLQPELKEQKKEDFLSSYSNAWLWSSDEVINELHKFLDLEAAAAVNPKAINILDRKKAFSSVMVAMRKDCGFSQTNVENYQFHKFIN